VTSTDILTFFRTQSFERLARLVITISADDGFHIFVWRKQKTEKCHKFVLSVSNFSKTFVISTEMQQIGNKKVIHRRTREIICNTFDYMRITFPFEALTKIGFLRICFFNLFSENLNLPRHSFLRRL
jgi:hypothetical protein